MHVPDPPSDDEIRARLRRAADRNLPKKSRDQDDPTLDPEETRVMHIEDELGRLDVSTEPHRRRLPENDPAFAERLSRLEARADRVRESREQAQAKVQRAHGVAQKDAQNLGRAWPSCMPLSAFR